MAGMATLAIIGNLGADPEVRHTSQGSIAARFRVAVNRGQRDRDGAWQDHTDWFTVTTFGALAERLAERLARFIHAAW